MKKSTFKIICEVIKLLATFALGYIGGDNDVINTLF